MNPHFLFRPSQLFSICIFYLQALGDASDVMAIRGGAADAPAKKGPDLGLIAYFALWYLGNYYYNIVSPTSWAMRRGGLVF